MKRFLVVFLLLSLSILGNEEKKLEIGDMLGDINKMAVKCYRRCGAIANKNDEIECVEMYCSEWLNKYHDGVIYEKANELCAYEELFGNAECSKSDLINEHYYKAFLALMMQEERKLTLNS